MFIWANKTQFRAAYTGLTQEDASAVVAVLKDNNTPYRLTGDGTTILVPEAMVYDVRLTMASEGIPKGGASATRSLTKPSSAPRSLSRRSTRNGPCRGNLSRTIARLLTR